MPTDAEWEALRAEVASLRAQVGPPPIQVTAVVPQYKRGTPQAVAAVIRHARRYQEGYREVEWQWEKAFEDDGRMEEQRRVKEEIEQAVARGDYAVGQSVLGGRGKVVEPVIDDRVRRLYQVSGEYYGTVDKLLGEVPYIDSMNGGPPVPLSVPEYFITVHEGWQELYLDGFEWAPSSPVRYPFGGSCACHPENPPPAVEVAEPVRHGLFGRRVAS